MNHDHPIHFFVIDRSCTLIQYQLHIISLSQTRAAPYTYTYHLNLHPVSLILHPPRSLVHTYPEL